jgi:hypothetical protein
MKKFFLYIAFFFTIAPASHAQITKGTVLTGLNLGASTSRSETSSPYDYKHNGFRLEHSIGFVIKDNDMIGVSVSYGRSDYEYEISNSENDYYNAAVYYRRYVPVGKRFYLFGQAGAGYGVMEQEETSVIARATMRQNILSLDLSPGITYALTKRFLLETGIGNIVGVSYRWDKSRTINSNGQFSSKGSGASIYANANPRSQLYFGFRLAL